MSNRTQSTLSNSVTSDPSKSVPVQSHDVRAGRHVYHDENALRGNYTI
jgi:hypothetical protein